VIQNGRIVDDSEPPEPMQSIPARGPMESITKSVEKAPAKWRWAIWVVLLGLGCLGLLLVIVAMLLGVSLP
jgi:hypothetical protein